MRRFIALLALLPWLSSAADINYTNIPLALGPVATNTVLSETNGHVARATIQQIMDLTSAQVATSNYWTYANGGLTNLDTRGWTNNTGIYGNGVGMTNVNSAIYVTSASLTNTIPITNVTGQVILTNNHSAPITVSNSVTLASSLGAGVRLSNDWAGELVAEYDGNAWIKVKATTGTGQTSGIWFGRGSTNDVATDWRAYNSGGELIFDNEASGSFTEAIRLSTGVLTVKNGVSLSSSGITGSSGDNITMPAGSGSFGNVVTATNGFILQCKPSFTTNFTCTTNLQVYFCNGTNQIITLPNAANVSGVVYRITVTNGWAKVIVTNATGAQTIRDGTSLSFTQIGIGNPSFISDGAHWWSASRLRAITPNAQFSCSTNIPMTSATTSYPVTFDSTDFNNSQGITLAAGTNGLNSKMWITNSGQYEFSPSIVINFGGNNTVTTWFKKDGVNIDNSATAIKGAAGGSIRCVTIPFVVSVTNAAAYEIWVQSTSTGDSLSVQAAGGAAPNDYPASPSIICPVKRISEIYP